MARDEALRRINYTYDGEIMLQIQDKEFTRLTGYLQENFGINLTKKRTLIESRLNNYLTNKGYDSFGSYIEHALSDTTGKEVSQMINFLTTNYSYFMREWEHFKFFKDTLLPELISSSNERDLRIWSAGCSTGQEPYTLAMLISDVLAEKRVLWDAKVLATDISLKALEAAQKGVYEDESLAKVPNIWKMSYFNKLPEGKWEVKDSLKNEVIFRRFNLIEGEFPFKKKFNVIFCRNVMIYFNETTKANLIKRFYDATAKGGYLFIGQSESLDKRDARYEFVMPSVYRKVV